MYSLDDYFGVNSNQLQTQTRNSSEAPLSTYQAGTSPVGAPGTIAAFTDWRNSPVFWLALFAVFTLGMVHLEGTVKASLR